MPEAKIPLKALNPGPTKMSFIYLSIYLSTYLFSKPATLNLKSVESENKGESESLGWSASLGAILPKGSPQMQADL